MILERLTRFVIRRRKAVLVASVVFLVVSGALGGDVASRLRSGGFQDPAAESSRAENVLRDHFGQGDPNLVLLVTARGGDVDDPDVAQAAADLTNRVAVDPDVDLAVSYWTLGSPPPLKSRAGDQALILVRITGTDDEITNRVQPLVKKYTALAEDAPFTLAAGGLAATFEEVGETIERDLTRAEAIALPFTLLLLVLVFGGIIAAALPIGIGVVAILGTFLVLRGLTAVTDVSIFALNLTTAMGLALAIDYALFVVSRFREELRGGYSVDDAVVRSVRTAGRTVLFSAATVAISLSALLIFPLYFLRSFAYAGIAVVGIAAVGAVVVLPALLAVLGMRVGRAKRRTKDIGEGFWHRVAITVMRRPIPIATIVMALLLLLGAPFLNIQFGLPDDRVLPPSAHARQVNDQLRTNFDSQEAAPLGVVAAGAPSLDGVDTYARALSRVEGAARVDAATGSYIGGEQVLEAGPISARFTSPAGGTWLSVVPSVEPVSPEGEALVRAVRAVDAPFEVLVGGQSAMLLDGKTSIFDRLPLALALIAIITFTVLFLMFGSVLVPAKAVVLNLFSLTATFGAMVWIFQEGNLSGLLDFTATGTIDTTTPILMFCVAFGLSMDYEVFLLSRIKEEHDRGADNTTSVAVGLERTGRIVTAAAALVAIVFLAMTTSSVSFIKLFGLGLAMAVIMDATLVRGALVPAFMRLAGQANWWAPGWLRRIHDRFGISESDMLVDLHGAAYRLRVLRVAEQCSSEIELHELLEHENLTVSDLVGWGGNGFLTPVGEEESSP